MIEHYASFFASLEPTFCEDDFRAIFTPDAIFADPFQKVVGVERIMAVFAHMYATLEYPRFEILETIGDESKGYIRWMFYYNNTSFEGVSHVQFDSEGLVRSHIDYWDAALHVYEKIPLLGCVLRFIKKRLAIS